MRIVGTRWISPRYRNVVAMRPISRSPKARPEIEAYIVPDGTCFLFDPARDEGFALDQLGALVWDYCDGHATAEVIIAEVAALLPEQPDIAARVEDLLATFAAQGLLDTADEASPSDTVQAREGAMNHESTSA